MRSRSVSRLAALVVLTLLLTACASQFQPRQGHDGVYPADRYRMGPEIIDVDPGLYPFWSLDWFYFDRHYAPYSVMVVYHDPWHHPHWWPVHRPGFRSHLWLSWGLPSHRWHPWGPHAHWGWHSPWLWHPHPWVYRPVLREADPRLNELRHQDRLPRRFRALHSGSPAQAEQIRTDRRMIRNAPQATEPTRRSSRPAGAGIRLPSQSGRRISTQPEPRQRPEREIQPPPASRQAHPAPRQNQPRTAPRSSPATSPRTPRAHRERGRVDPP